jgi:hypothetical protein
MKCAESRTFAAFLLERKHSAEGQGEQYLYPTTQQASVFRLFEIEKPFLGIWNRGRRREVICEVEIGTRLLTENNSRHWRRGGMLTSAKSLGP